MHISIIIDSLLLHAFLICGSIEIYAEWTNFTTNRPECFVFIENSNFQNTIFASIWRKVNILFPCFCMNNQHLLSHARVYYSHIHEEKKLIKCFRFIWKLIFLFHPISSNWHLLISIECRFSLSLTTNRSKLWFPILNHQNQRHIQSTCWSKKKCWSIIIDS